MNSLDIFQKLPGGTRLWVRGAGSVQEAKALLLELQRSDPSDYYACDLVEKVVILATTRTQPELHAVSDDSEFFGAATHHREGYWRHATLGENGSIDREVPCATR